MRKILLITGKDDPYRRPLLEAQGYGVNSAEMKDALSALARESFQLVLVNTESGVANTVAFCARLKQAQPGLRVGIIANRSDSLPQDHCADVVIYIQHSPAKFIGAINTLFASNAANAG
jgi:CheY-like chemotaxis protein